MKRTKVLTRRSLYITRSLAAGDYAKLNNKYHITSSTETILTIGLFGFLLWEVIK